MASTRNAGVADGGFPMVTATSTHEYCAPAELLAVNSAVRGTPAGAALGTRYTAFHFETVPALIGQVTPRSLQKSKSTCPRATPKTFTVMVRVSPTMTSWVGVPVKVTVRLAPGMGLSGETSTEATARLSVPQLLKSWA